MNPPIHTPPPTTIIGGKPYTKWDLLASVEPPSRPWLGGKPTPNHQLAEDEDWGLAKFIKRVS